MLKVRERTLHLWLKRHLRKTNDMGLIPGRLRRNQIPRSLQNRRIRAIPLDHAPARTQPGAEIRALEEASAAGCRRKVSVIRADGAAGSVRTWEREAARLRIDCRIGDRGSIIGLRGLAVPAGDLAYRRKVILFLSC